MTIHRPDQRPAGQSAWAPGAPRVTDGRVPVSTQAIRLGQPGRRLSAGLITVKGT